MSTRTVLTALATAVAAPALALGLATPAQAMHNSPAPVGEMAPEFSGHYDKPDIGSFGEARPWEAGPAWNR